MKECIVLAVALTAVMLAGSARESRSGAFMPVDSLKTPADSVAYAFGASIARDLKRTGLESLNSEVLARAISDIFAGRESVVGEAEAHELIMRTLSAAREKMDARLKEAASSFMEANKTRPGIQETTSGLQYEVLREGTGPKPALSDTVTVHYKGQLPDGTVFDSSYERGEPVTFPLNRVIEGWQEGVQLMPAGSHYRLYIPYELGYGERGAGQNIPPYSPLIFEVELLSVQPAAETTEGETTTLR